MPAFNSLYCGICWYFANSACQAAADSGGRMPVTGCHSVIDSPDQVSRVMPPITTIAKIIAQHTSSQIATGRRLRSAASRCGAAAMLAEANTLLPRAGVRHDMRKAARSPATLRHFHRMQLAVDVVAPEIEKLAELGEIRRDIEFLPDEGLQGVGLVGQAIDDLRRGQPVLGGVRGSAHRCAFRPFAKSMARQT